MSRKVNEKYVENFSTIIFTQPLRSGRIIEEVYSKTPKGWLVTYNSDSAYHICPYDGAFRNCKECGANDEDFDVNFCLEKRQYFTPKELVNRIEICLDAKLNVRFVE